LKRRLFGVADTSVLLAVYNRKDSHHEASVQALSLVDRLIVSPMVAG
jgi:predicted nucleic acid-binding protein